MTDGKKFALIGAAGYVAPRHMAAIRDVGGDLVAALDPHDSVGILDSYFPSCLYFREPERFDRWLSKNPVDYVVVCSPNYLHDSHCLMAMRSGADVICEKPLVLYERNLDNLAEWELKTGKQINVILQCRLHPDVMAAREWMQTAVQPRHTGIVYHPHRGLWYNQSWKGSNEKSGGLLFNIGIHLFDLVCYLYGDAPDRVEINQTSPRQMNGWLLFGSECTTWSLSLNDKSCKRSFQVESINEDSRSIDLTTRIHNLHTEIYQNILADNGYGIEDIRPATRLVERLRHVCA